MLTHTDAELEAQLSDIESDQVERKESFGGDAPEKVRQAVCAFANDLPNHRTPGVVFIGARDDGSPAGLEVTDELLRQLADIKTDGNIVPPPTLTVMRRTLRGARMVVITVAPADSPPVRYKGRIWIRVGSRRAIASAQDERILNEKRRFRDKPFDSTPVPSSSVSDLDRRLFEEEYLPAAVAPEIVTANDRTYEERLATTKMVATADDPMPTVVGLLTLGLRVRDFLPGAYVQFLRVADIQLSDNVVDESVIDGPIAQVIRRLDEKLTAHNRVAVEIGAGLTERRRPDYPLPALQQLTRNALLHRTYEGTNAPVRVYWFDDHVEIGSPGGPYGEVTIANFGKPGVADYRNPNLAEALRVFGFVQRYGFGIQQARRDLAANGNPPPEFEVTPGFVFVRVRKGAE